MRRVAFALLVLLAVPAWAAIAPEVTVPAAGRVVLPAGISYITEVTLTNHRDQPQYVAIEFLDGKGPAFLTRMMRIEPKATLFADSRVTDNFMGLDRNEQALGALRFTAITEALIVGQYHDEVAKLRDSEGRIEVKAHIIKQRGPFGVLGTSRQEIEGIPINEYTARENIFVGVIHHPPTYTNVGIVNLHPTETVTFYVQYEYLEPFAVTVPPLGVQQVRVAGGFEPGIEGTSGRYVVVTPEWAQDGSGRTTPWVAYASTIDGATGDAFSGVRVPPGTNIINR